MSYGTHVFAVSMKGYIVHQAWNRFDFPPVCESALLQVAHPDSPSALGVWQLMPNAHQGSTPSDQVLHLTRERGALICI